MHTMTKTVLLGVTGCIAAYKAAELVRLLQKRGYRVKVVMTDHATEFVGPTTFRALTREPVAVGLFDNPSDPIHHISLAQEADVFLIAPCTANCIAKLAQGIADDLLSTTALATKAPIVLAPAMNEGMYDAAATQENLSVLMQRGVSIVDADEGYLACGDTGRGRLAELEAILETVDARIARANDFTGKHVLVTAGPTVEPLDPVRFISNYSSGKMGYMIAEAIVARGGSVTLISGPVALSAPMGNLKKISVKTAQQMFDAACVEFSNCDIAICSAAVSDMRPKVFSEEKLKKDALEDNMNILELVKNPDILAELGSKKCNQFVVGFAAETNNLVSNAKRKLEKKKADLIVANEVGEGKGFGVDLNEAILVSDKTTTKVERMSKRRLADEILDEILRLLGK